MIVLIDGCNVIKRNRGLLRQMEKLGFRQACEDLVRIAAEYALKRREVRKVLVFFDSKEEGLGLGRKPPCVEVRYSRGQTADEAILAWIENNYPLKNARIVSDDLGLRRSAQARCGGNFEAVPVECFVPSAVSGAAAEEKSSFTHAAGAGKKRLGGKAESEINRELKKRWNIG